MPTELPYMYIVGVIASMHMFWLDDQNNPQTHQWGVASAIFLSLLFGLVVGYIYIFSRILGALQVIWQKKRIKPTKGEDI